MGNIIYAIVVLGALGALFGLILSVASKILRSKRTPARKQSSAIWPVRTAAAAAIPAAPAALPPF